jgi:hypothetical protein
MQRSERKKREKNPYLPTLFFFRGVSGTTHIFLFGIMKMNN